jgi:hypothetical protein
MTTAMGRIRVISEGIGKGLVAGAIGTAAMTVSSALEAKLRRREGSDAPAEAAGKVLGVQPRDPEGRARFSNAVHWAYGTGWGAVRGLLGALGQRGAPAAAEHFALVWGSAQVMLPSLEVAPPPWRWGPEELAIDGLHHAIYAGATGLAYELIDR